MSPPFTQNAVFLVLVFFISTSSLSLALQPNYEPPQPSSEFATAEATAKIAQLEASGVTASHTNLMAEVAKLSIHRRQEENKRGGMTF